MSKVWTRDERLGQQTVTNAGHLITIVEYNGADDIVVEFEDGTRKRGVYGQFKRGQFKYPVDLAKERLGEEKYNIHHEKMKIVEYIDSQHITVQFEDGTEVKTQYANFTRGVTGNPNSRTILDVGHMDMDIYCRYTKIYYTWYNMLYRCHSDNWKKRCPTYEPTTCCEEWLYFSNFYEWAHHQSNYALWEKEDRSGLDKDIKIKHNTIYAPDRCYLVPARINSLFIKADKIRNGLPIGVYKRNGRYHVSCGVGDKSTQLAIVDNPIERFNIYKKYKENIIKQEAQKYYSEGRITKECYEAMNNYIVEIDD